MTKKLNLRLDEESERIIEALGERWFPKRSLRDAAVMRRALELAARAEGIPTGEGEG